MGGASQEAPPSVIFRYFFPTAVGFEAIPDKYKENLELKDVILEVANDLWHDCQMSEYDYEHRDPVWIQKYIEMSYQKQLPRSH